MSDRRGPDNVKVGLFVLIALVLLIGGSLWIAGSALFGTRQISYLVLMNDSGGLRASDRVRVAGVPVGRVRGVELKPGDPWPVRLSVPIRPGIPIHEDAAASIATSGLLGAAHLVIEPGSTDAPELPEGGEIHGEAAAGLQKAMARVDELADAALEVMNKTSGILDQASVEIGPILANLQLLLSEENAENVRGLLANLRGLSADAAPRLQSMMERLETLTASLQEGVEGLPELTERVAVLLDSLNSGLGPEGERLAGLLDSAQGTLVSAEEVLVTVSRNRAELEWVLRDLRDTMANLKAFSQQVKERPFSLVRIKTPPERSPGDGAEGGK
jgi:phospholipid/cholesterol/gamma-HCH transport system substrate-binding protein